MNRAVQTTIDNLSERLKDTGKGTTLKSQLMKSPAEIKEILEIIYDSGYNQRFVDQENVRREANKQFWKDVKLYAVRIWGIICLLAALKLLLP